VRQVHAQSIKNDAGAAKKEADASEALQEEARKDKAFSKAHAGDAKVVNSLDTASIYIVIVSLFGN